MTKLDSEVVVVGAGPAGSIVAALLAASGHHVIVLERERFPRFKIGESLLPVSLPVLERVGLDLASGPYQVKHGSEFLDEGRGEHEIYPFCDALPGGPRLAYHVERSRFDADLAQRAIDAGADVRFATPARGVEIEPELVTVRLECGCVRARYLVDASGSRVWMGRRERSLTSLQGLGRAASFVHFREVDARAWAELSETGNIKILRVKDGWVWIIPLHGRKLSVGVVRRDGKLEPELVLRVVEDSPLLSKLTAGSRPGACGVTGDYSYANRRRCGPRWVCVGDSAGFVDPVFSSGIALATVAAQRCANRLAGALECCSEADPALMDEVSRHMSVAYRCFHLLAHRFYNSGIVDNLFLAREPDPEMRQGLITVLAGDVWRNDNPFQNVLLSAARREALRAPWFEERTVRA